MTNRPSIYLTTTLPYANGRPHLGHLFELVLADIFARSKRQLGHDVWLNTGLDEHGEKIAKAAGDNLEQYREELRELWKEACEAWQINHNSFYVTHSELHHSWVRGVWSKLVHDKVLEKKPYKALYCVGCESFKTQTELQDGVCPDHPNLTPQEVEEENYFFQVESFKKAVLDHARHELKIHPKEKRQELINIVEATEDFSVSRLHKEGSNLIPSTDQEQDIYVWFDALLNYTHAAGYRDNPQRFFKYWTAGEVVQICGPDNLRFQGSTWQFLLNAQGIPLTNRLVVHGTIVDSKGRKFSKTLGNTIDPADEIQKYGIDAVRYYIAAGLNTYKTSKWDSDELVALHDAHLVNAFGNLARRVTSLAKKFGTQDFLFLTRHELAAELDAEWTDKVETHSDAATIAFDQYLPKDACAHIASLNDLGNTHINDVAPWSKDCPEDVKLATLKQCWLVVLEALELYWPIIPETSGFIKVQIESWKLQKEIDPNFKPEPVLWFQPLKKKELQTT